MSAQKAKKQGAAEIGGPPILKNVAPLALLERVTPELLLRFLRPYESYLLSRGVAIEGIAVDDAWVCNLHEVLQQLDPEMPSELQQALVDIGDLANTQAHEEALDTSERGQLGLFTPGKTVSVFDTPFQLYLENRREFDNTLGRLQSTKGQRFVEYRPVTRKPLPDVNEPLKQRLRETFSTFFSKRNRTAFCDLRVIPNDEEILFLIIHGQAPRTHGVIKSADLRERTSYVGEQHDMVILDRHNGRLSVHSAYAVEKNFYRQTFGEVFYRSREHFKMSMQMSGRPLIELGIDSLSTQGFPAIDWVSLLSVTFNEHDGRGGHYRANALDSRYRFEQPFFLELLERAEIVEMKFRFVLKGQKKPVLVNLSPNSHSTYDRRVGAAVVRAFLLGRGFIVPVEHVRGMPLLDSA